MRLFRLSLFFLSLLPAVSLPGRRIPWKTYSMLAGTPYTAAFYVFRSLKKGPVVLLFAPHGDERSAGYMLIRLLRSWRPDRGTLVISPVPVPEAWRAKRRFWIEDLNRQFAPESFNFTPVDLIASEVKYLIRRYKPGLLLNIHEGWGFFRKAWRDYGQSIVVDTMPLARRAERLAKRINRKIPSRKHHFIPALKPMSGTLTYWAQEQGIPAFGVEVSRLLPLRLKLHYQFLVLRAFLKESGITLRRNR